MNNKERYFRAVGDGDIATLTSLLDDQPALIAEEDHKCATGLIVAARNDRLNAVDMLLQHGADWARVDNELRDALCWAAAAGYESVVGLLLEHVDILSINRAASWAWRSDSENAESVLELLRTAPVITSLWKGAGLPFQRLDNFTMTEVRINLQETLSENVAMATFGSQIGAEELPAVQNLLHERLRIPALERERCSSDFGIYRLTNASVSDLHLDGSAISYSLGFEIKHSLRMLESLSQTAHDWRENSDALAEVDFVVRSLERPAHASSFFRGPYGQIGYAHAFLRDALVADGFVDAAHEIREQYLYWEAPESDSNIIALMMEIEQ